MASAIPVFLPGEMVPMFCSAAVLAGRFVKVTADKTASGDYSGTQCTVAGEYGFGVATQDSAPATDPADSQERRMAIATPGAVARVKPGGAIAAFGPVKTDASGQAIAQGGTGTILGYAMHTVAGTEALVEIKLV